METHLTSKHVEQKLEEFQKRLSSGNLVTTTKVDKYERIARNVDDAIRCVIKATWRHNMGYHRSPALTETAATVRY